MVMTHLPCGVSLSATSGAAPSDACHPQRGHESFDLPTFVVGPAQGSYARTAIPSAVLEGRDDLLRLPRGPVVQVAPTANCRTVSVIRIDGRAAEPHFLKLHYPRRLSRFRRHLSQRLIVTELWASEELFRTKTVYLPELPGTQAYYAPQTFNDSSFELVDTGHNRCGGSRSFTEAL